jgi:UDP-glucose 4-epimerase
MDWKNTRVLVTGGSGFIGSYLVDLLCSLGAKVVVFDRSKPRFGKGTDVEYFCGTVTEASRVRKAVKNCDIIFHLAGMLGTHELLDVAGKALKINCGGTINLINACILFRRKLVFISKPNIWLNVYSITKNFGEGMMHVHQRDHGLDGLTIKLPTVFGGRQPLEQEAKYRKAIPTWIDKCLRNNPIEIYGTGDHKINLIYVEDAVRTMLSITQMEAWDDIFVYTAFQIESNVTKTTTDLAHYIKKLTGSSSEIIQKPMPCGEEPHTAIPGYPIQSNIVYPSRIMFEENIKTTIEWYRV